MHDAVGGAVSHREHVPSPTTGAPMIAFTFPGQGSQQPGMGRPWADHPAWALVAPLALATGRDLEHLLLAADADELRATANAQVATLTMSLVVLDAARRIGITPGAAAGHSLGEHAALVAAGALTPTHAAVLVATRAAAMQAAADAAPGTMAAVLGLDDDAVAEACAASDGAWLANLNAPGQAVISGTPDGVDRAAGVARRAGARRVVPLEVGGAFHSPLMAPAAAALADAVAATPMEHPTIPVVADVDGAVHRSAPAWRRALVEQLTAPVHWRRCQHTLHDLGVTVLAELGPGGVLTGLAKRTLPDTIRLSVATPSDLDRLVAVAGEAPGAAPPDGDQLHGTERLIVSPAAGSFDPAADLAPGQALEVGHLVGRVGDVDVRSRFAGRLAGLLALPGERLIPAQPVAWLRAT